MEFAQIESMMQHWQREPPLEQLVAAYMGFKPAESAGEPRQLSDEERRRQAEELIAMFGGGVVR